MTRYTTRQDIIDSIAGIFGDFADDYDIDAIIDEAYAYLVDEDENGQVLLNTAGFELVATGIEFWEIVARHETDR